jgi:uncharacterized protein
MAIRFRRALAAVLLGAWLPVAALADVEDIRRDALGGNVEAQVEMGILYEFGFHMPDHEVEALAWYLLAAENGSRRAAERRDLLIGRLTETQREDALRRRAGLNAAPPRPAASAPAPTADPSKSAPAPVEAEPATEPVAPSP